MAKIVIAGGPCRGKSEVIEVLASLGFSTIAEKAREIIERCQKQGIKLKCHELEEMISEEQEKAEAQISSDELIFLDRSIVDCYTYSRLKPPKNGTAKKFKKKIRDCAKNRYDLIFFLDSMPQYKKDAQRHETEEEADRIHEALRHDYENELGYKSVMINVPWLGSHEKRAGHILAHIIKYFSLNIKKR